ncbi:DUF937 domain-containing protein [Pseudaminobacter soli (ex Li et al. 2025)]|uniref:DUF937 domain-containing protein n=1 Tax=Pseudaminobacter soli (ex Li et al. 2025) TaxID=1295366 RepID=A0A2P7SGG7_9HYPH|nr:DUF937 domain-containing protein [Mesorhizobium soli]PSJ61573.1 hypothetical protein C7I85_11055 [Mesorhizobium soli]
MASLFDLLNNSQNGSGMEALARQFNLSMQQTQAAVEALLPAFSQGLKQNTSDPYGIGAFLQAMTSGQHAKYFDDPANAFTAAGMAEGNGILGHLFGSKDLSKAVAANAAAASGVSQEILKQMLPVMASMIMGGLFRQSTGTTQGSAAENPFAQMFEQMMRQSGMMPGTAPQQAQTTSHADNPFGQILDSFFGGGAGRQEHSSAGENPFGQLLEGMFGGAAKQSGPAQAAPSDNPFGKMLEQMFGGGHTAQPEPEPQVNPSGRPRNPYDDMFGKIFEAGAKQRDEYQKSVESIFEQFTKGMSK